MTVGRGRMSRFRRISPGLVQIRVQSRGALPAAPTEEHHGRDGATWSENGDCLEMGFRTARRLRRFRSSCCNERSRSPVLLPSRVRSVVRTGAGHRRRSGGSRCRWRGVVADKPEAADLTASLDHVRSRQVFAAVCGRRAGRDRAARGSVPDPLPADLVGGGRVAPGRAPL